MPRVIGTRWGEEGYFQSRAGCCILTFIRGEEAQLLGYLWQVAMPFY